MIKYSVFDRVSDDGEELMFFQSFIKAIYHLYTKSRNLDNELEKSKLLLNNFISFCKDSLNDASFIRILCNCIKLRDSDGSVINGLFNAYDSFHVKRGNTYIGDSIKEYFKIVAMLGNYRTEINIETRDKGTVTGNQGTGNLGSGIITEINNPTEILYKAPISTVDSDNDVIKNTNLALEGMETRTILKNMDKVESIINDRKLDLFNSDFFLRLQNALYFGIITEEIKSIVLLLDNDNKIKLIIK